MKEPIAVFALPWRVVEQTRIVDAEGRCVCDLAADDSHFSLIDDATHARMIVKAINHAFDGAESVARTK